MHLEIHERNIRLNPRDPHFYNNPYPYYDALRQLPQPFYWEDFDLWCFAHWDDVNALLRDRRFGRQITHLRTREELGWPPIPEALKPFYDVDNATMIQMEPPDHTRLRSLVQKAFMARQIESLRPQIQALCDRLIDEMLAQGEVDLLPAYATPIPVVTIANMLGVPVEMSDSLLNWSHAMVAMYELGRTAEQEHRAVQATQEFYAYLSALVQERRRKPTDDLITRLIEAEDQGNRLTEHELISGCMQLLNAGHEATVNVIGNGVFALLTHRDQWDRLVANPSLSRSAAEELMRFDTPLHLFTRWVLDDLSWNGHAFKFGDTIALLLGAANRDPRRFANPNTLDITRADNPHVSFGGGIHFCIGAPLARLELDIALSTLARRVPGLELMEQPEYRNAYHFHGLKSLRVRVSGQ
ncbi:MAG: cytochrome P450 [Anaerolineae bacterium]|nr:cytochrome P450 [Candidatus Roseilinea sp.]MDW8449697.1 cytochrome P450 [Anaerolineae bacterium]